MAEEKRPRADTADDSSSDELAVDGELRTASLPKAPRPEPEPEMYGPALSQP